MIISFSRQFLRVQSLSVVLEARAVIRDELSGLAHAEAHRFRENLLGWRGVHVAKPLEGVPWVDDETRVSRVQGKSGHKPAGTRA